MPKKANITAERINSLMAMVDEATQEIIDIDNEIRSGRVEDIPEVIEKAANMATLARAAASLAGGFIWRHQFMNRAAELEKLRAEVGWQHDSSL